jgi:hypothetical protein
MRRQPMIASVPFSTTRSSPSARNLRDIPQPFEYHVSDSTKNVKI